MKKFILVVLASLLFTGCTASVAQKENKYYGNTDWEAWETLVTEKHEELETLIFENIEIETYETNTNYWD